MLHKLLNGKKITCSKKYYYFCLKSLKYRGPESKLYNSISSKLKLATMSQFNKRKALRSYSNYIPIKNA